MNLAVFFFCGKEYFLPGVSCSSGQVPPAQPAHRATAGDNFCPPSTLGTLNDTKHLAAFGLSLKQQGRKEYPRPYFVALLATSVLLSVFLGGCLGRPLYKDTQVLMGTFVEVISPSKEAGRIVFAQIKLIEELLSSYRPESEIAQLNRLGRLRVSRDTFFVIKKAKEFWQLSGGAFDITVGPLIDLWGFRDKKYRLPQEAEIRQALALVGSDKIILQEKDYVVEFMLPGMKVDLGAIAKGYALDCAVARLKAEGILSCLINAGGQVYALGDKFAKPWRVAVRRPRQRGVSFTLELRNESIATSGDYEQFFFAAGRRYSHIFNPQTGYPVDNDIISVTVAAPEALTADALSTCLFVLGSVKGRELMKHFPQAEVKILEK